jgi:frataxin
MPDTENPSTPKRESTPANLVPSEVTDDEFHVLADEFLEKVHEKAEQIQEGREDVEVEYAVRIPP